MKKLDQPKFNESDYQCLRQAIKILSQREFDIIVMRFWECLSIAQIADILGATWDETEAIINTSLNRLKQACLSDLRFSRSK